MQLSVCVFCGSSPALAPSWFDLAAQVGRLLAAHKIRIVYGGASAGMMGALADAALSAGGTVLGILPDSLQKRELAHPRLSSLRLVPSLAERKTQMIEESQAFLTLPGGFGTLDELFEVVTIRQVGLHQKPIALLDHDGFYQSLHAWIRTAVAQRFVPANVSDAIEPLANCSELDTWLAALPQRVSR